MSFRSQAGFPDTARRRCPRSPIPFSICYSLAVRENFTSRAAEIFGLSTSSVVWLGLARGSWRSCSPVLPAIETPYKIKLANQFELGLSVAAALYASWKGCGPASKPHSTSASGTSPFAKLSSSHATEFDMRGRWLFRLFVVGLQPFFLSPDLIEHGNSPGPMR